MEPALAAVEVVRKSGDEEFHRAGAGIGAPLVDFWRWAASDLLSNAMRGVVAEYVVGLALGCADRTRREWDAADLLTHDGVRVEVKSAAYLQTWAQAKLSPISFDIRATFGWDATTNIVTDVRVRQSDVYVFALLHHQDKATVDPLDLDQWTFHVLATKRLDDEVPNQQRVGLARLLRLEPDVVDHAGLCAAVSSASRRVASSAADETGTD